MLVEQKKNKQQNFMVTVSIYIFLFFSRDNMDVWGNVLYSCDAL